MGRCLNNVALPGGAAAGRWHYGGARTDLRARSGAPTGWRTGKLPGDAAGHDKPRKKLTPDQVRAIAERIAAGERHTIVSERFGVSVETVGAIKSGKRWAGAIDEELRAKMQAASAARALDADGARRVMEALEAGRSGSSIAEEFEISPSMVSAIKHGRAWSALDPDLPARLAGKPAAGQVASAPQVAEMKQRLPRGAVVSEGRAEFGVSASTVQAIARGRTWTEVAPRGADDSEFVPAIE